VLLIMWPRTGLVLEAAELAFLVLDVVSILVPLLLLGIVLFRPVDGTPRTRVVDALARLAVVLPLLGVVAGVLSRFVSNGIYAVAAGVTADFTAPIARLEAPLIEAMQTALADERLSYACALVYAGVWFFSLLAAALIFTAARRHRAAWHLLTGWLMIPLIAAPLFLLIPVFEPWAVNPLYGYEGPAASQVRFLAANTIPELRDVALNLRWATGACLPSLHVAIPALAMRISYKHRLPALGWYYAALTAAVGFAVVYLGRHWIVDVVAGVGLAMAVAELVTRIGSHHSRLA
jgi:membrane-associated phospholipid phosphatase